MAATRSAPTTGGPGTSAVADVRRFNRLVTEVVGALDDHYLGRARPLGESRVLWEIGQGTHEIRALRARLDLDSGYVSRLLQRLEASGLVVRAVSDADRRVGTVTLTRAGRAECRLLDERSDELAASLLAPLSPSEQEQLVDAMRTVERLLTAGQVRIAPADPEEPGARWCLESYVAELDERFPTGFDPGASISATPEELRPPRGLLLVARLRGEPVGCGALKHGPEATEVKRMWVAPTARGLGLGRRLLAALEDHAARLGATTLRLETNRTLTEAIALYRSAGYREVAPFNDEPYAHHWFEKHLDPRSAP